MSFGKIVLLLIVIYCIVKSAVKNGMEEYFAMLEAKKCELIADESEEEQEVQTDYMFDEKHMIEVFRKSDHETKRRLLRYFELVEICKQINEDNVSKENKRNVSVIQDIDGNNIVVINDIRFKGKRSVDWNDVEKYLRQYVGDFYQIAETEDIIYIGTDLPDEYVGSKYTKHIKGTFAKAKANAAQAIPEMIEIATSKTYEDNKKNKHSRHAKNGWYRILFLFGKGWNICMIIPFQPKEIDYNQNDHHEKNDFHCIIISVINIVCSTYKCCITLWLWITTICYLH